MHYIFSLSWPCCKRSLFPHCQRKYASSAADLCVCVCVPLRKSEMAIWFLYILDFCDWVLYSGEVWETNLETGKNNLQSYTCLCPRHDSVPEIFSLICMCLSHEACGIMNLLWVIYEAIGCMRSLRQRNVQHFKISPAIVLSNWGTVKALLTKWCTHQWSEYCRHMNGDKQQL